MNSQLAEVYKAENFKDLGYQLIDVLAEYLENAQNEKISVQEWLEPQAQLEYWQNYQANPNSPIDLFKDILQKSMHLHHPRYIGHQVVPTAPISALANLMSGMLNNGMAVYEMGTAASAIEQLVTNFINEKIGFGKEGDGFITSGGTLANLTALLTARQVILDQDIWTNGQHEQLGVMVSEEAHYCIDRAARIMGLGSKGIIKVPVDAQFRMRLDLLEEYYQKAQNEGIKIFAIVGSAPSTSTGIYDNLEAIAQFAQVKNIWLHVDGAHGGAAIFSEKYKDLLKGIQQADSVAIDGHKMMMMPGIMTFLLYKNAQNSYKTFLQKAQYLWSEAETEEWYNLGKRTFECTKEMMSIKFYTLWQIYGESVFEEFVTTLYDLGKTFAQKIKTHDNFELAVEPDSNIVCFRYVDKNLSEVEVNTLNQKIRQTILQKNEFYIVQTQLKEVVYLRTTFMNPFTTEKIMEELLEEILRESFMPQV